MPSPSPHDLRQAGVPLGDASLQSAHWLGVTLYSIGDAVIATDTQTRITFMNPVAEALTGWNADDAIGQPLKSVFHIVNQETRNEVESPVDKALRDGVIVGLANHTVLIAKDATERPIDDSAAPIRDDAQQVAGVVLVFRDISERYQYEQKLRDSLDYVTNVLATLRESLLVLDANLRVVSANPTFYQSFSVAPEDTEGACFYDLGNHQWDIPQLRTLLEEILQQNHSFEDFEVGHDFPVSGRKIMRLNARRIRKPGDDSELILLAIEDATEQIRSQRRLETSEKRYRRLFESARDGILILDTATMRIVDANPYMQELLGYTHEQFVGRELWEIGLFTDKSHSQIAMQTLKETGYVRYEDLPLETSDGARQDVEFVCNVYEEDGSEVAQCNIRDITERKQLEQAVQEQIRIREHAKALAVAGRRKDEFLAMLSHELRNPMAPLFNALELIGQDSNESDLQREARGVIERQVRHLSRLTDDLLEVSRISTGRIALHLERVDINGIIKGAVERLQPSIDRRGQKLSVSLADEVIWLHADASRLEQVIGNLLNNGSKYNQPGGHIRLSVERLNDHAVIRVQDDGIGISPELLPDVFDLFTQADKSLDRAEGGLGIGLALVKSLTELHRGMVEARSDGIGHGSEFTVHLPVAVDGQLHQDTEQAPFRTEAIESLRILVVDDSVDAARMCAMLLRSWGHEVRMAHDGSDALQRAAGFHPHVILCDIGLPHMDGYEVARHIRQNPHLEGVLLVAITGYGQDSDRRRSKEVGFDQHLVKPVDSAEIKALLATCHSSRT